MRAYSKYLNHLRSETNSVKYHLGGSTPPILFPINKYKNWLVNHIADNTLTDKIKSLLAKKVGCLPQQIVFTPASTQACVQVLAAITEPNDTILIEYPTYEPYLAAANFLGLKVERFQRSQNFMDDFKEIKKKSKKAKVLLISNPHCPTGWIYDRASLLKLSELPLKVVVDEVFLPICARGKISQVDFKIPNMISISSLSKSTGFSFIRFGWIIGSIEVAKRAEQIALHFHSDFPQPILPYAYLALKNWREIQMQLSMLANKNRLQFLDFLEQHPQIESSHNFQNGFYGLLKIPPKFKSSTEFSSRLLKENILVRDASFFEMPHWVRMHLMLPPADFKKALKIISSYYQQS